MAKEKVDRTKNLVVLSHFAVYVFYHVLVLYKACKGV